jgi:hypothetical protein
MPIKNVPFFEYPRLWSDDRNDLLSIIDNVEVLFYRKQYLTLSLS